jgi:hypothetical protein
MPSLSRFHDRARSVLARRSDVGERAACQKRADWSRPAIGTSSDAATQRDNRRNGSRGRAVARYQLSLPRGSRPSSGLDPHLRCPSHPGLCLPTRERARAKARLQTLRRGRHAEVHGRYTRGTSALWPASTRPAITNGSRRRRLEVGRTRSGARDGIVPQRESRHGAVWCGAGRGAPDNRPDGKAAKPPGAGRPPGTAVRRLYDLPPTRGTIGRYWTGARGVRGSQTAIRAELRAASHPGRRPGTGSRWLRILILAFSRRCRAAPARAQSSWQQWRPGRSSPGC